MKHGLKCYIESMGFTVTLLVACVGVFSVLLDSLPWQGILWYFACWYMVIIIHELGHVLSVRHYNCYDGIGGYRFIAVGIRTTGTQTIAEDLVCVFAGIIAGFIVVLFQVQVWFYGFLAVFHYIVYGLLCIGDLITVVALLWCGREYGFSTTINQIPQ